MKLSDPLTRTAFYKKGVSIVQLTGPVFLFIFLPLSFLPAVLCPRKHRTLVLTLLSLLWYALAYRQNLAGLWRIAGLEIGRAHV